VLPSVGHEGYPHTMSVSCAGVNASDVNTAGVILGAGQSFTCIFDATFPAPGPITLKPVVFDIGLPPSFTAYSLFDDAPPLADPPIGPQPTVPTDPGNVTATVAGQQARLDFDPSDANGSPISRYPATCDSVDGGVTRSGSAVTTPIVISDLTAGAVYTCSV